MISATIGGSQRLFRRPALSGAPCPPTCPETGCQHVFGISYFFTKLHTVVSKNACQRATPHKFANFRTRRYAVLSAAMLSERSSAFRAEVKRVLAYRSSGGSSRCWRAFIRAYRACKVFRRNIAIFVRSPRATRFQISKSFSPPAPICQLRLCRDRFRNSGPDVRAEGG